MHSTTFWSKASRSACAFTRSSGLRRSMPVTSAPSADESGLTVMVIGRFLALQADSYARRRRLAICPKHADPAPGHAAPVNAGVSVASDRNRKRRIEQLAAFGELAQRRLEL